MAQPRGRPTTCTTAGGRGHKSFWSGQGLQMALECTGFHILMFIAICLECMFLVLLVLYNREKEAYECVCLQWERMVSCISRTS